MSKQDKLFVPYTQSKTAEERIAHVKANPGKYMSLPLKNKLDEISAQIEEISSKQAERDKKMDMILNSYKK